MHLLCMKLTTKCGSDCASFTGVTNRIKYFKPIPKKNQDYSTV